MGSVRRNFWDERYRNWDGRSFWGLGGHIVPDFFRTGVYWLVKSQEVKIQGYYGRDGGWQLHALAIGGPFLQGHRLVLEQLYDGVGKVSWDGSEVEASPRWADGGDIASVRVTRDSEQKITKMRVRLPAGVSVNVDRSMWNWGRLANIDAYITMRKQPDQDGHCGKADGSFAEDEYHYLYKQWGQQVAARNRLFDSDPAALLDVHQDPYDFNFAEVCANSPPMPEAEAACAAALNGSSNAIAEALRPGCLIDVCALGLGAANATASTLQHVAEAIEAALPPDGWYDSGARKSCDEGCEALGLVCTEEQLLAHNGDVDTSEEVLRMIRDVAGGTGDADVQLGICDPQWGEADDVPNWSAGGCHQSSSSRALSTFNCAVAPRGGWQAKHRLCYCHAPVLQ